MTIEFVNPSGLPTPVGPYSHAARSGSLLFCSGQLALDSEDSSPRVDLDASEQTQVVLENLEAALEHAGSSRAHVLRTTVYLASLDDYSQMNAAYGKFFSDPKPARATVEVAGLIGGLRVEIDAIAVIP